MQKVDLQRYRITGRLGAGADYDVRSAIDLETGTEVALKRPVPQAVTRRQHGPIEARTARMIQAYHRAGNAGGLLAPLLGYTEPAIHDAFFGDNLAQPYTVLIQARAPGIPLMGDMMSRITGIPVAAGQNLFAMFPLIQPPASTPFQVHNRLLDLEQAYLEAGYILLDLRPQNVFYQPAAAQIQVIDTGALAGIDDPAPHGRPPLDVNDACLELLKFYTTPDPPPQEAAGYRDARGLRPVVNIPQELDEMRRTLAGSGPEAAARGQSILDKIANRAYTDYRQFGADLNPWLEAIAARNQADPHFPAAQAAWREALEWLRGDYWTRFQFDAPTELAPYSA